MHSVIHMLIERQPPRALSYSLGYLPGIGMPS